MNAIRIGDREVGASRPCFIIAEAGVNHNGDIALARRLIDAAAAAGADAVKFQTFRADRLAARDAATAEYQRRNAHMDNQREMLARLELSEGDHRALMAHCRDAGVTFLSSPFDEASIDFLDLLDVPAFKVPSPEAVNGIYLAHMGAKRRPVILSTGMCDLAEVMEALATLEGAGTDEVVVLHCTSHYPAVASELNLRAMATIAAASGRPVGYSDHSDGIAVPIAAVALGACMIEKHLTIDRALPGPDHRASLEPDAFKAMVEGIRETEAALGSALKTPQPSEDSARRLGRKSLSAARNLAAGERIAAADLRMMRPADGLGAHALPYLVGRRLRRALAEGERLSLDDFEG